MQSHWQKHPELLFSRRQALAGLGVLGVATATPRIAMAAPPQSDVKLDALVGAFMRAFEIPGVGVAIVRPNRPDYLKGYGVRTLGQAARIDVHTQFAIASNSKAFTAAALAIMVDEGRMDWDAPVSRYLPEFRMYDASATQLMTVRDLLVHRSGLPLGAGDLLHFPKSDHTKEDVLKALQHFKPATGFRAGYAYDNILYIVAGLVLEKVSGQTWDEFIGERIFGPLGMEDAVTNTTLVRGGNHAGRHHRLGPPVIEMGPLQVVEPNETALVGPSGGIQASLADVCAWLHVQLAQGRLPDGRRLWSTTQSAEMWTPQSIVASGPGPTRDEPQRSVMQGYALGWNVTDYRQNRVLSHGGGLTGQITKTVLLPDLGIGFALLSNTGDGEPISGLRYAILDHLIGAPKFDWIASTRAAVKKEQAQVLAAAGSGEFPTPAGGPSLALDQYAGRYRDPWYGDIVVSLDKGHLAIAFTRTPALRGALEVFGPDAFRTRFAGVASEDAVVHFAVQGGRVTGVTMNALSPLANQSFDYQDLSFVPVLPLK